MDDLLTDEERGALMVLLNRMGEELGPPWKFNGSRSQWKRQVARAAERTLDWIDTLESDNHHSR